MINFEKILLHVKAHVAVVDRNHRVVYCNQDVPAFTHITNPELIAAVDDGLAKKCDFEDVSIRIPFPGLSEKDGLYDLVVSGGYMENEGEPLMVLTSMNVSRFVAEDSITEVDINSLMREIDLQIKGKVAPRTILNFVLGSADSKLETDPVKLQNIIISLLNNAVATTQVGSITYGYELWPDAIYFFVKSTSGGLATERRAALLENGNPDVRDRWFADCRKTIASLGGESGVDSAGEGKGALYWFTLPDKVEDDDSNQTTDTPSMANAEVSAYAGSNISFGEKKTILVAEDNESNYFLISSILEDDYHVIHAHDGREALEMWEEQKPDLILMDINMPYMDGYEATRRIRQVDAGVPIIAVTAYAFASDRVRIMDSGFNSYVSKPVNADRLVGEIRRCLAAR